MYVYTNNYLVIISIYHLLQYCIFKVKFTHKYILCFSILNSIGIQSKHSL